MADLPDKLYYSIREIAEHTGVEPHVLRYWETEFPTLRPKRARSGARTYRRRDVEEIQLIRRLLHEEGYRIEGARKFLRERRQTQETPAPEATRDDMFTAQDRTARLQAVRAGLREVLDLLAAMKTPGKG
ncbi:MAG: MerR family transcriptional regulator [Candidatus Latescibacteria bacterium]|nr:MerR family transcriptional regulator [Candidatus Latescibacterota bacterium]